MPHWQAGVYIFAFLLSGVSAAIIPASAPGYTHARHLQSAAKQGQSAFECQASSCQIAYLNSVQDFCLWAPSQPKPGLSVARNTEHALTAWCTKTHLLDDAISRAHFVKTPKYVQVSGVGNLTSVNAPAGGVAGASSKDDHVPGLVFTSAYGRLEQIHDWMSFVSEERFCFRACNPSITTSTDCPRVYDVFGCTEDVPGGHDTDVLEDCTAASSTLDQQILAAPAYLASGCMTHSATGSGRPTRARRAVSATSGSTSSTPIPSFSVATVTTSTEIATTMTITFPTPTSNTAASLSTATPIPPPTASTSSHSLNHTYSHSRQRSATLSASISSSFSNHSSTSMQPSSRTRSSLGNPSSTLTASTYPSSNSSRTPTSSVTSTSAMPTSIPPPVSTSSSSSSYTTSLSLSDPSPSSPASSPTTSTTSLSTMTIATSSTTSSTSSQSSDVLTFPSPSPSTTSPATSSPVAPSAPSQLGSQCPLLSEMGVNAGSITPSTSPLVLLCTILMVVGLSLGHV